MRSAHTSDKDREVVSNPPLHIEQWCDFIIASASQRSQNQGQQRFGDILVQRYFVTLPERYKDDSVASIYFDDMLCAVASAVRGFSVVRDVFQTNSDSLKASKDAELDRVKQLDAYSPLNKDGLWGKVAAVAVAGGVWAPLSKIVNDQLKGGPALTVLIAAGCIPVALFVVEFFVGWLRDRRCKQIEQRFPNNVLDQWQERALKGYRTVLMQFMPLALEITHRHYPGAYQEEFTDEELARLIERHFAFKLKSTTPAQ